MSGINDPWMLPSCNAYLDEVESALLDGFVSIGSDPTMPAGLDLAVTNRLSMRGWRIERLRPGEGVRPVADVSQALSVTATLDALLTDRLADHVVVVDLSGSDESVCDPWHSFCNRFSEERRKRRMGLSLALVETRRRVSDRSEQLNWAGRLRRIDVAIWADLHAPHDREEPIGILAAALGVELCGWRLDLAAEIARASVSDILDPLGWLSRRDTLPVPSETMFNGRLSRCPLRLLAEGDLGELRRRIWRSQLTAVFPWMEEVRQEIIQRYRKMLKIDDYLAGQGVKDVEEIEFGSIAFQLRRNGALSRGEMDVMHALAEIRNALAHRTPASTADLERVFSYFELHT